MLAKVIDELITMVTEIGVEFPETGILGKIPRPGVAQDTESEIGLAMRSGCKGKDHRDDGQNSGSFNEPFSDPKSSILVMSFVVSPEAKLEPGGVRQPFGCLFGDFKNLAFEVTHFHLIS
jgi:hypothetical protein